MKARGPRRRRAERQEPRRAKDGETARAARLAPGSAMFGISLRAETLVAVERTVAMAEEVFGPRHPRVGRALEIFASALEAAGHHARAAEVRARADAIRLVSGTSGFGSGRAGKIPATQAPRPGPARPASPAAGVLAVGDAARYLAISADTLYGLVRSGEVPHTRVGRSIRFRPADLDRYLEERTSRQWVRVDRRGRPRRK